MLRSFLEFFQRVFWLGGDYRPATETFQRAILGHLSMTGSESLAEIGERSFPSLDPSVRDYGFAEAAQILANRGVVIAERSGVRVDPASVGLQDVRVRLVRQED